MNSPYQVLVYLAYAKDKKTLFFFYKYFEYRFDYNLATIARYSLSMFMSWTEVSVLGSQLFYPAYMEGFK